MNVRVCVPSRAPQVDGVIEDVDYQQLVDPTADATHFHFGARVACARDFIAVATAKVRAKQCNALRCAALELTAHEQDTDQRPELLYTDAVHIFERVNSTAPWLVVRGAAQSTNSCELSHPCTPSSLCDR